MSFRSIVLVPDVYHQGSQTVLCAQGTSQTKFRCQLRWVGQCLPLVVLVVRAPCTADMIQSHQWMEMWSNTGNLVRVDISARTSQSVPRKLSKPHAQKLCMHTIPPRMTKIEY